MKKILSLVIVLLLFSLSYAQWDIISTMPIPVKGAKAVVQDTVIYIVGGYSDSDLTGTKRIQAYYPESNSWGDLKDSITVPRWGLSAESFGDSAYIFGGATTASDSSFSIEGWGYKNQSKIRWYNDNFNRSFAATAVVGEYLYIFGGYPDFRLYDSLSYLVRFNMTDGTAYESFSINDSFAVELPSHQMAAVLDNKIYIFGGILNTILRKISYLDIATHYWHELDVTLTKPRAGGVALSHPNGFEIILIGGKNEGSEALDLVETFDTQLNEPQPKRPMSLARSMHTAVVYKGNMIYVFGGKNPQNQIVSEVERIDFNRLDSVTSIHEKPRFQTKEDFELVGNFPNPFNPRTEIKVRVNQPQILTIKVFDIQGRKVKTLYNDFMPRGLHNIAWDANDDFGQTVTSGIYFYRISSGKLTKTDRMLLIK